MRAADSDGNRYVAGGASKIDGTGNSSCIALQRSAIVTKREICSSAATALAGPSAAVTARNSSSQRNPCRVTTACASTCSSRSSSFSVGRVAAGATLRRGDPLARKTELRRQPLVLDALVVGLEHRADGKREHLVLRIGERRLDGRRVGHERRHGAGHVRRDLEELAEVTEAIDRGFQLRPQRVVDVFERETRNFAGAAHRFIASRYQR